MLYISSRSKSDSFTAHRTLCTDRAPDGGVYIPYRIPAFSAWELQCMKGQPFGQIVATVLNQFFSGNLSAWDVDVCVGRTPVRFKEVTQRLFTVECFHNPGRSYDYLETNLYKRLAGSDALPKTPGWVRIAIRISVLFGLYSVLPDSLGSFDISVNAGDFTEPMAAWYAKKMGMPIQMIICSCEEKSALWDLFQRGEMNTVLAFPKAQSPDQIESLIFQAFGIDGAVEFADLYHSKGTYHLNNEQLSVISDCFSVSVIGNERITNLIRSVYQTNSYYITTAAAIAIGGLQDYRASSGIRRDTLIFQDLSPAHQSAVIAASVGISENDVLKAF